MAKPATQTTPRPTTVDPGEVARFSAMAADWWNPTGKFRPLHKINPVRLAFIRDAAAQRFSRDPRAIDSLKGLRVLDIGCGGGLLCEPLARLGADVVGVDPSETNIGVAATHAAEQGLAIDYRADTAEDLADSGETFDIVLNMEVVEHVADVDAFIAACASMVRPGGLMVNATINRTLRAFALAIVGAEYVLRWLPRGTHQWDRFVTPEELAASLRKAGLEPDPAVGVIYNPIADDWFQGRDTAVNYMLLAKKPG